MRLGIGPDSAGGCLVRRGCRCSQPRDRATPQRRAIASASADAIASRCDCCKVVSQNAPLRMRFSATLLRCPFTLKLGQVVVLGAESALASVSSREVRGARSGGRREIRVTASWGWCNYLLHRQRCDLDSAQSRQANVSASGECGASIRALERRRSTALSHRRATRTNERRGGVARLVPALRRSHGRGRAAAGARLFPDREPRTAAAAAAGRDATRDAAFSDVAASSRP